MQEEELQRIPLHQSLILPFTLLYCEREVALFFIMMFFMFLTTFDPYASSFGVVLLVGGLWAGRKMAEVDPILLKSYLRYKGYNKVYEPVALTTIGEESPASAELSSLLPWGTLIRPDIVLNKDGSLTACFFYRGKDVDSSTFGERNLIATQMKDAVKSLGSNWMVQTDTIRVQENNYPHESESSFSDWVSLLIERERREAFQAEGNHYITITVLTVTYVPPIQQETKLMQAFIKKATSQQSFAEIHLQSFDNGLNFFIDHLSIHLAIDRMGTEVFTDEEGNDRYVSSLAQYLNYCLTGENFAIEIPKNAFYLDSLLSYHRYEHNLMPRLDNKFVSAVSISGFPQDSLPNILRALDSLPMEYRINFRFVSKSAYDARKLVDKQQQFWKQKRRGFGDQMMHKNKEEGEINQEAERMSMDVEAVKGEIDSGLISYGYFSATILLRNEDPQQLDLATRDIQKALRSIGFDGFIEALNTTEAFLGSLPGESFKNIRRPIVSSWNLTHLICVSSIWAGRDKNPCEYYPDNSPPLMYAATTGTTPFRVNVHCGDVGHTLIMGPTGNGKSTLASLMMTQFMRYEDSQLIVFDKGRSSQPIIEAMGGKFYNIGGEEDTLEFYPLANVNGSQKDFLFALDLIETMMVMQDETVTPEDREDIIKGLHLLKDQEVQTITDFRNSISNKRVKQALMYYDQNGGFPLLSGDPIDVPFHTRATGFEMGDLMDMGEKAIIPTIIYLFHEIQKRLDGRPTYIHMAEAWTYLNHPIFLKKIIRYLKELRKMNCFLVMDTQTLSDLTRSGAMSDLNENCPTKIYLPNKKAGDKGTSQEPGPFEFYSSMGLNPTQINIIKTAAPKREYYFTHPEGNRLFNMNLGPVALAFVGRTGKADLARMEDLKLEYGEEWTKEWLVYCGVDYYRYCEA